MAISVYLDFNIKVMKICGLRVGAKRVVARILGHILASGIFIEQFGGKATMRGHRFEQRQADVNEDGRPWLQTFGF